MTEYGGNGHGSDHGDRHSQQLAGQHGYQALEHIAKQRHRGSFLAPDPQYIGGARIARALGARIGQAHDAAYQNGAGNRTQQIAACDQCEYEGSGFHGLAIGNVAIARVKRVPGAFPCKPI